MQILIPGTLTGIMKHAYKTTFLRHLFFVIHLFLVPKGIAQIHVCSIDTINYEQQLPRLESFLPSPIAIETVSIKHDLENDDNLSALIGIAPQSVIACADLKKAVFYLAQKNKFKMIHLSLDPDRACLEITLESFWTFDRLKIKGIMFGKAHYARLYLLQSGDQFDIGKHEYSCSLIEKKLKDEGYCDASVFSSFDYSDTYKTVKSIITINTGKSFKIAGCTITGIQDLSVMHSITTLANHYLGKTYSKDEMHILLDGIQNELDKSGYCVINSKLQKKIDSAKCTIDLILDFEVSAKRFFIFEGNAFFKNTQLRERILLFGHAAWQLPVDVLVHELQAMYRDNNFSEAIISATQEGAICKFRIHEGKRILKKEDNAKQVICLPTVKNQPSYYFGKTILQNCSGLPAQMILRELDYQEGDTWSQERVNESITRLKTLEIFDLVHLYPIQNFFCPDQKTMLLKVHEDDPYEFRLRAGASLQQMSKEFTFRDLSYVAGGAFLVKNPFNYADQFRLDAEYTYGEQTLSASYIRPWLFGWPIKANFEIYATQYLQPGLRNNQKNIYSFVQQGFLLGFNHKKNIFDTQLNTGIEWMETTVVDKKHAPLFSAEITRALNFEPLLVDKKIPYALFEPTLVIDRLNNKLNPTHGSLGLFSLKGMFPLRYLSLNSFFVKIFMDQSIYVPIYNSVLALRARAGHIFYKDFKNVMPAERFYLGGANSIRSYETDMCPPLGTVINHHGKTVFVPQGARSLININAELRIPIYQNFWMALFQDLGALSNNHFADIKAQDILAGTGFGLRYNTPIGPLRFDVAWKWHRPDHAISRYSWFLSFGNAF